MKRLVALWVLMAASGAAAPSRWDRIRDPNAAKAETALTEAYRARLPKGVSLDALSMLPVFESALALESAAILESAGGAALDAPELWYRLGADLVIADRGRDEEGRMLLLRALERDPNSAEASRAWLQVAIASNRLGDYAAERSAYDAAVRVEWDPSVRAELIMNRGEANMSMGDLHAARADYLLALATTTDAEIVALARWGLAVALARDDDLPDALRYAGDASEVPFRDLQNNPILAIDLPQVFYTPQYEIAYYRALGSMAEAERADDPEVKRQELEWARSQWLKYLAGARPAGDKWTSSAERMLDWCERRLDAQTHAARRHGKRR
jgi:tetratricopeptide (TPR) repeat protein